MLDCLNLTCSFREAENKMGAHLLFKISILDGFATIQSYSLRDMKKHNFRTGIGLFLDNMISYYRHWDGPFLDISSQSTDIQIEHSHGYGSPIKRPYWGLQQGAHHHCFFITTALYIRNRTSQNHLRKITARACVAYCIEIKTFCHVATLMEGT